MSEDRAILITGGTVVPMTGRESGAADVLVVGNRIAEVGPGLATPPGCVRLEAHDSLVLPGFVQTHIHLVQSLARHRAEGRLAPGYLADIAVLRCESWASEPLADPADVVVFGMGVESVRHVLVDGTVVVENGRLLTGDAARIRGRARAAGAAVAERLGWS